MKVIATAPGYLGCYRKERDTFEVPDDAKATWFKPATPDDEKKHAAATKVKTKPATEDAAATKG